MTAMSAGLGGDRGAMRFGAAAAMIGAAVSLIFNLLHPRTSDYDSVRAEIELVRDSGIWRFDHFMIAWSLAFIFVGLIALSSYIERAGSVMWARYARAGAIGGVVVGYIAIAVDGMAMSRAAEAGGPVAEAVAEIGLALFTALQGSLIGLTPLLFGLALLASTAFPRWHAYVALAGGVLGLLAASIQYLAGPSALSINFLFTPASLLVTVWLFMAGLHMWKLGEPAGPRPVRKQEHAST